jgi:hypothetical protein
MPKVATPRGWAGPATVTTGAVVVGAVEATSSDAMAITASKAALPAIARLIVGNSGRRRLMSVVFI